MRIANPMSEREAIMRPAMLGSLLDAAAHNLARGAGDLRLFESGNVHWPADDGGPPVQQHQLLGLLVGRDATALAAKGLLEAVLDALRVPWSVQQTVVPMLHPGKAGAVASGGARDRPVRRAAPAGDARLGHRRAGRPPSSSTSGSSASWRRPTPRTAT